MLPLMLASVTAAPDRPPKRETVSLDCKALPAQQACKQLADQLGYELEFSPDLNADLEVTLQCRNLEPWLAAWLLSREVGGSIELVREEKILEVLVEESEARHRTEATVDFTAAYKLAADNWQRLVGRDGAPFPITEYRSAVADF